MSAIHFVVDWGLLSPLSYFYWPAGLEKKSIPIEFHTTALFTNDLFETSCSICGHTGYKKIICTMVMFR